MTTTKAHFEIFKKECRYWIQRLGLTDWEIEFKHNNEDKESFCNCRPFLLSRSAVLTLTKDWEDFKLTNYLVRRYAFHEVCELLMGRLDHIAEARFVRKEEIEEERHAIIRRLENAFFEETA